MNSFMNWILWIHVPEFIARPMIKFNHLPTNELNKYSNCCWRSMLRQHLQVSLDVSSSLSQLGSQFYMILSWQGCSQLCWTVECASSAGKWYLLPDVPCTSCICRTTLLLRCCKYVQSPRVRLLCAGALPSLPHGLNAAVRPLVSSRDQQEEPDWWPCADSTRLDRRWRPRWPPA